MRGTAAYVISGGEEENELLLDEVGYLHSLVSCGQQLPANVHAC